MIEEIARSKLLGANSSLVNAAAAERHHFIGQRKVASDGSTSAAGNYSPCRNTFNMVYDNFNIDIKSSFRSKFRKVFPFKFSLSNKEKSTKKVAQREKENTVIGGEVINGNKLKSDQRSSDNMYIFRSECDIRHVIQVPRYL